MLAGCQSQLHPSDHSFLARICMSLLCWDCPCCSHPWSWEQRSVNEHSVMNNLRVMDEDALSSSHLVSWPSHVREIAFVRISFPGRRAAFPPTNSTCLGLNEVHCPGVLPSLSPGQPHGLSEDGEHLGSCHPDSERPACTSPQDCPWRPTGSGHWTSPHPVPYIHACFREIFPRFEKANSCWSEVHTWCE